MKRSAAIYICIAVVGATLYAPIYSQALNNAVIGIFQERTGASITCGSVRFYLWRGISAEGIKAVLKTGHGLSADSGRLDYDIASLVTGRLHVSMRLKRVRFLKADFLGDRTFGDLGLELFIGPRDLIASGLSLEGDEVRVSGNAVSDSDKNIACLIRLFLSDKISDKIPPEIRGSLLDQGNGRWSSVSVGIMGNYSVPVLRIFTESFRINISNRSI